MRVLLVSTERGWQGGERQALLLARGLASRGHECVLLARGDGRLLDRARAEGVEAVALAGAGQSPRGWLLSRRLLLSYGAEVVHFNDPRALTAAGPVALSLPRIARIASRRVAFPLRNPWLYRRVCQRILCVSAAVRDRCLADGLPAPMLRVVHDGVDSARIRGGDGARLRESLGVAPDTPLILTLASLVQCKGHADLLAAAPAVLQAFPEARFLLAGEGAAAARLADLVRSLGVHDHVAFLGLRDDIGDLLAAANLLVLPSHEEGLGSSVIEAMLAGTAVVATNAGGIPELLRDGDTTTGWLTPVGDVRALGEAIVTALQSPDQRREKADRARARALRLFTDETMIEATLAAYREVRDLS